MSAETYRRPSQDMTILENRARALLKWSAGPCKAIRDARPEDCTMALELESSRARPRKSVVDALKRRIAGKEFGGKRDGAGRKPTVLGGKQRTPRLTDAAWAKVQAAAKVEQSSPSAVLERLAHTLPG